MSKKDEKIKQLTEEIRILESLYNERQKVLNVIPPCKRHGECVPHAIEWIEKMKKFYKKHKKK